MSKCSVLFLVKIMTAVLDFEGWSKGKIGEGVN